MCLFFLTQMYFFYFNFKIVWIGVILLSLYVWIVDCIRSCLASSSFLVRVPFISFILRLLPKVWPHHLPTRSRINQNGDLVEALCGHSGIETSTLTCQLLRFGTSLSESTLAHVGAVYTIHFSMEGDALASGGYHPHHHHYSPPSSSSSSSSSLSLIIHQIANTRLSADMTVRVWNTRKLRKKVCSICLLFPFARW